MSDVKVGANAEDSYCIGLKDTRDAAAYVRCSMSFLEKLRCFGGGPVYVKLGRSVRYRTADLDNWVASQVHCNSASGSAGAES